MTKIWECKIGGFEGDLPMGADLPMRMAIRDAYYSLTGEYPEFNFSGWGGNLTAIEQQIVEEKRAKQEAECNGKGVRP